MTDCLYWLPIDCLLPASTSCLLPASTDCLLTAYFCLLPTPHRVADAPAEDEIGQGRGHGRDAQDGGDEGGGVWRGAGFVSQRKEKAAPKNGFARLGALLLFFFFFFVCGMRRCWSLT